jgi:uncharacterized protein
MQLIDGAPAYSATDLVAFLACEHLTNLDLAAAHRLVVKPLRDDPALDLIARRGIAHERRYLQELRGEGLGVHEVARDGSGSDQGAFLRAAAAETRDAMRSGVDVIYQATFFDGRWRGHADFLRRVEVPSDLGPWSYEVADTKLARKAKAGAIVQLCVYTDLLAAVQGIVPEWMEVALGGSARARERFRVADAMAWYRAVRRRFEDQVDATLPTYPVTATYPEPVEHCEVCRWGVECGPRRRRDDHLSLVAGITRRQRAGLVAAGVGTVEELAALPLPIPFTVDGTSGAALERVREQARLQVEGRRAARTLFERLGPIEAGRGLALLPPPSPGDLFLDLEGDPFVEEGGADGLEYLFGIIDPGEGLGLLPSFHATWARDRAEERSAFERVVDLITARRAACPDMHVYHYAPYEPNAMRRLMGRHATREEQVDTLLRAGVFVDLYSVVRQGIRASVESYSIKRLEPLYAFERQVALRDAGSSIVNFELWLDGGRTDQALLDLIEAYNRDDCLSTWRLRDWLERQRVEVERELGVPVPRPDPRDGTAPTPVSERQALIDALVERLTAGLPPADERSPEQAATWLLAQLLDWHRREDRAFWWTYFAMLEMTPEELVESDAAIGGLTYEGVVGEEKRSWIHRYRFRPQENDIHEGGDVRDPATGRSPGTVARVDQAAGILDLRRAKGSTVPHPAAVIPCEFVDADDQKASLLALGGWVAEHGIDAPGPWRAARDLLLRRPPRAGQQPGTALRHEGETELDAAIRLSCSLDASVLAIQGPPGAGKTFTGAHVIVELVRAGRRVGVTANSHRVIGNLLDEVRAVSERVGYPLRIGQKPGRDEDPTCASAICYPTDEDIAGALRAGEIDVAGGTAWLWSDERLAGSVDVLVVDEAGQLALANALAVSRATGSLVLLGDPRQLEQPLQGTHPPGAEASALDHLLGGATTMPPALGLFLERTWRLHPAITTFTSEAFYEGRLAAEAHLEGQALHVDGPLGGAGLRWLAVAHVGNVDASPEEAREVARLCAELIGRDWTDQAGARRPLTWADLRILAPYNAQVAAIAALLPVEARPYVGTVDRFQGQTAAVSLYSMTTSSPDLAPRGMEFLYSVNRLNVATSRARCVAIVVASPDLLRVACATPRQVRLANALCRLVEVATPLPG